ncbi:MULTISPECIES: helix-turn-helix transcriptional regulator [Rhodocyclales]|jgi:transcriptional regulator with XRE-family HTH domain|uniref:helix-turn-helix domain-containing protein n=1 Tax=Rhodocyclales TaxID=206389 RepID=UPI0009A4BDE8|nr:MULTISPECIES: helix-turn-helix transcriptional regulator [Rhodocyclales]MCE1242184.1 helix-turn-helix domain-containing protein [Oryzomicrobium sp.]
MGTRDQTIGEARQRVAENLRRLRKERGLSQEAMAELAEFHRTYVSQLERCVTNISLDGLERLANALHVDVLDLLAHTEGPGQGGEGSQPKAKGQSRRSAGSA